MELRELFLYATSRNHFLFDGNIYDQIDGIAMGSPLAPTLANLFLGHHEEKWLNSAEGIKIKFYKRYMDDIFCIVENEKHAQAFLEFLNRQHSNIKFTLEKETNNKLPFLDVLIEKIGWGVKTSIYKKPTDTGLLTNFNSFVCFKYKIGLIKTLVDRIFKINSSWEGFSTDINNVSEILEKNSFPSKQISQNIKTTLNNKIQPTENVKKDKDQCRYFKLPFVGNFSSYTDKRIKSIIEKYCKPGTEIKIAFTSSKISSYFSPKDKKLKDLQSHVVYLFTCAGCISTYVGHTARHFTTRIREHLNTDKTSHVFKHLKKCNNCKRLTSEKNFSVLDSGNTKYALKIKEPMWIKWLDPDLNKQKNYGLTLSIDV